MPRVLYNLVNLRPFKDQPCSTPYVYFFPTFRRIDSLQFALPPKPGIQRSARLRHPSTVVCVFQSSVHNPSSSRKHSRGGATFYGIQLNHGNKKTANESRQQPFYTITTHYICVQYPRQRTNTIMGTRIQYIPQMCRTRKTFMQSHHIPFSSFHNIIRGREQSSITKQNYGNTVA